MSFRSAAACVVLAFSPALALARPAAPRLELVPTADHAADSRIPGGVRLGVGDVVEVRWSGIPSRAKEVELLLSVDGGHRFEVRLTDELAPGSGSFRWTVPALVTNRARIALRVGVGGKEFVAASTDLFTIAPFSGRGLLRVRWRDGEIWVDAREDGGNEPLDGPLASDMSESLPQITARSEDLDAAEAGASVLPRPIASVRIAPRRSSSKAETCTSRRGATQPLSIPQRI